RRGYTTRGGPIGSPSATELRPSMAYMRNPVRSRSNRKDLSPSNARYADACGDRATIVETRSRSSVVGGGGSAVAGRRSRQAPKKASSPLVPPLARSESGG